MVPRDKVVVEVVEVMEADEGTVGGGRGDDDAAPFPTPDSL